MARKTTCAAESSPRYVVAATRRLELSAPEALFFSEPGQVRSVEATFVDDATGARTPATGVWFSSSNPDAFSVGRDGSVTALVDDGSSQVIATAEGISSAPLLAVAATVPDGAVLIPDEAIVSGPTTNDEPPTLDSKFTAVIRGIDDTPKIGQIFISTGEIGLAGRVVDFSQIDSSAYEFTFEQVSALDAFPELTIDESFDLGMAPIDVDPVIAAGYDITRSGTTHTFTKKGVDASAMRTASSTPSVTDEEGPCELKYPETASLAKFDLLKVQLDINPRFDLDVDGGRIKHVMIEASPTVTITNSVAIQAAFNITLECSLKIAEHQRPLPGPIGLLAGGQLPLSIVMTAGGKFTLASIKFTEKTTLAGLARVTLTCPETGECQLEQVMNIKDAVSTPEVSKQSVLADGPRFEPEISAVLRVSPSIGSHQFETVRFVLADVDMGAKLSGQFGTVKDQLNDYNFASEYKVESVLQTTIGPQLSELAKDYNLEGILGNDFAYPPTELGRSPQGRLKTDKYFLRDGKEYTFDLNLDHTDFFNCCGPYNVDRVVLIWKQYGSDNWEILKDVEAKHGQKDFSITWRADKNVQVYEIYAFVQSWLLPWDDFYLEIARAEAPFSCDAPEESRDPTVRC
jgi:hypothetical protein